MLFLIGKSHIVHLKDAVLSTGLNGHVGNGKAVVHGKVLQARARELHGFVESTVHANHSDDMENEVFAADILRHFAGQDKADGGRYLEPCLSGGHSAGHIRRTDTGGEGTKCTIGAGVGVGSDDQVTGDNKSLLRKEGVFNAHFSGVIEVRDVEFIAEVTAGLGLDGGLDVLVRNKVVHYHDDLFLVENVVLAHFIEFADGDGRCNVVAEHPVQVHKDELARRDRVEPCVCRKDLLCHSHAHKSFPRFSVFDIDNGSSVCRGYQFGVAFEISGDVLFRSLGTGSSSAGNLLVGDLEMDAVIRDINGDHVPFLNIGDEAVGSCFRRDVTNGCATGGTGEAAVRDKGNFLVEAGTGDGRGRVQHFTHARAACRALVADNYNVTRMDTTVVDDLDGLLFAVEDTGRSSVGQHFGSNSGAFYYAAVGRQITEEDGNSAGLCKRIVQITNDFRVKFLMTLKVLCHSFSGAGHDVGVNKTCLGEFIQNTVDAAGLIEVLHIGAACWCQMADVRRMLADFIDAL